LKKNLLTVDKMMCIYFTKLIISILIKLYTTFLKPCLYIMKYVNAFAPIDDAVPLPLDYQVRDYVAINLNNPDIILI
jgi:hypothetical protein